MKIKLSKTQWESIGKQAGWQGAPEEPEIAAIGRNIIENSDSFINELSDVWEDAVSEGIEDMQKTNQDTTLQHFKDYIHERITMMQKLTETIEQASKQ